MILFLAIMPMSCVEPFDFQTESFEQALVVEARITNELIQQEIKLSQTYRLEEDGPNVEPNAIIFVKDDTGTEFDFDEIEPGTYKSIDSFAVQTGRSYQLNIRLINGRSYVSTFEETPPIAQIDRVYGDRVTNASGFDGLSIFVDASNVEGEAQYFRYQYEETYKLIAPEWKPIDVIVYAIPGKDQCLLVTELRPQDQITCYVSPSRKNANVLNLSSNNANMVQRHPVRFISDENYKMASRYSILVRQLVQTRDSNAYFEALDNFTGSGNLFSQLQAGYIQGNISSESNSEEPVIGFFEVATLDTNRYFFNYSDFYQGSLPPPYFVPCEPFPIPDAINQPCAVRYSDIIENNIVYFDAMGSGGGSSSYRYVQRLCGDCTEVGTPEIPEFWEE